MSAAQAQVIKGQEYLKLSNLNIVKSAKPGYWIKTVVAEPANLAFPPQTEEGCVDQAAMFGDQGGKYACDIVIVEDRNDRARFKQCNGRINVDMHKLMEGKYMVTVTLPDNTKLIHNYQRTGDCNPRK